MESGTANFAPVIAIGRDAMRQLVLIQAPLFRERSRAKIAMERTVFAVHRQMVSYLVFVLKGLGAKGADVTSVHSLHYY